MSSKVKRKIYDFIGQYFLSILIGLNISSLRIKVFNKPDDLSNKVFIFWHSKMLIGWWFFKKENFSALVSKSSDGDILSKLLQEWQYVVFRGSSSKGGKDAIEEIIQCKKSTVITPDGPRGPAKEMKNGALIISNKTGYPIIPIKIDYSKKKILHKSWDRFEIPLPFSECKVSFGKSYFYEEFLSDDELLNYKREISSQM